MRFEKQNNKKGAHIPPSALKLAGLDEEETLKLHVLNGVTLLVSGQMAARDILQVIESLKDMSVLLLNALTEHCDQCDGCGGDCPYLAGEGMAVMVPDRLLEEADLPRDAHLRAFADPERGIITIRERLTQSPWDELSPELQLLLTAQGICPDSLEEHLREGDIICGE